MCRVGGNILAMARAILWGALLMLEIMGRSGVSGLWILGRPYNVGIVGWCSMRDIQVFIYACTKMLNYLICIYSSIIHLANVYIQIMKC